MIVEVHHIDRQPFILVFALWKLYNLSQTTPAQCSLGILSQLVARGALRGVSRSELILRPLVNSCDEGSHRGFGNRKQAICLGF